MVFIYAVSKLAASMYYVFQNVATVRETTSVTAVSHRNNNNIGIEEEGGGGMNNRIIN